MNLIDAHVTKVINKRRVAPLWGEGRVYDVFTVEYYDEGGSGKIEELWFLAEEEMDIKEGYVFQH